MLMSFSILNKLESFTYREIYITFRNHIPTVSIFLAVEMSQFKTLKNLDVSVD